MPYRFGFMFLCWRGLHDMFQVLLTKRQRQAEREGVGVGVGMCGCAYVGVGVGVSVATSECASCWRCNDKLERKEWIESFRYVP